MNPNNFEDHPDCNGSVLLSRDVVDPETNDKTTETYRVRCRRNSCISCGPWLKRQFIAHYFDELRKWFDTGVETDHQASGKKIWYTVLTLKRKLQGPFGKRLKEVKESIWKPYIRRVRRQSSESPPYLKAFETGDSGRIHLNLLLYTDADASQLKSAWQSVDGGYINHTSLIGSEKDLLGVITYMAKEQFADPELGEDGFPGHRTNGCSQHIPGYTSDAAREKQKAHARKSVVDTLLSGDPDERPICDRKAFRMYLTRLMEVSTGQKVITPHGPGRLVEWSQEGGAVVEFSSEDGSPRQGHFGPFEVWPRKALLPRLQVNTERPNSRENHRASAPLPAPDPHAHDRAIESCESIFRLNLPDGEDATSGNAPAARSNGPALD
jgi:hypothetical protein